MLITVRMVMCHLCMALLGTISVNRIKLCWTRRGSDLPSPLWEPHRDYEKHRHKTFIIIKGFASFEGGLWVRLRFFFPLSLFSKAHQQFLVQDKSTRTTSVFKRTSFSSRGVKLIIDHINNSKISVYFT